MRAALNSGLRRVPTGVVYIGGLLPAGWLIWQALNGGLGVDPVKVLEHEFGIIALQFLMASLVVTPLLRLAAVNLMKFRRALGLLAFAYVTLHLLVWLGLDLQLRWGEIWADIVKRWYITIGMLGFVLMLPLALTSWNGAVRRMGGASWRRLHMLAYPAVLAGAVHFAMQEKVWTTEAVVYLSLALGLVGYRFVGPIQRRMRSESVDNVA